MPFAVGGVREIRDPSFVRALVLAHAEIGVPPALIRRLDEIAAIVAVTERMSFASATMSLA